MEKFVPYAKLSKKAQKELNRFQRQTWGTFSPVTRRAANKKKTYQRKRLIGNDD